MTTAAPKSEASMRLRVEGMHCAGCVGRVEGALKAVPGVTGADVSLAGASAIVRGRELDPDRLAEAVRSTGFGAEPVEQRESLAQRRDALELRHRRNVRRWKSRVIIGGVIWVPLEFTHWFGPALGIETHHGPWMWGRIALALVVFAWVGSAFFVSAARAARRGATNMDTLVSIGAIAAVGLSVVNLFRSAAGAADAPLYFTEAAGLLTLIAIGHWLEAHMTARAGSALRELLRLQPDRVTRLEGPEDAQGREMPAEDVQPGDLVLVRPGERVAVDGEILRGASSLDESVVTGESIPVDRSEGEPVVAGSVNLTGRLVVRATTDGASTTLARIAEIVYEAQSGKTRIQRLADRVASIFVPAVLGVALVTVLAWGLLTGDWEKAVLSATTVLVISCPCALGLATPTAVMAGSGAASRRGILVREVAALERAAAARIIAFDKTGTLTAGRPRVAEASDEALALGAALAGSSTHPLSAAIVEAAQERGLTVEAAEEAGETPGVGLAGRVGGRRVEVVSAQAAEDRGVSLPPIPSDASASAVIEDGRLVGVVTFRDEPRPEARSFIESLHAAGVETHLLSGDRREVAESVAEGLGIPPGNASGALSPHDKVARIRELSGRAAEAGGTLVMVGDGINDAAALAEAGARGGVGIAVGTGANVAIESAGIVIPGEHLGAVGDVLGIGRATLRTIRQNLFLAFVYNTLAIPAAAFGLLGVHGPIIAAGAMALSDVSVLGNSLRLAARLRRDQGANAEPGTSPARGSA